MKGRGWGGLEASARPELAGVEVTAMGETEFFCQVVGGAARGREGCWLLWHDW